MQKYYKLIVIAVLGVVTLVFMQWDRTSIVSDDASTSIAIPEKPAAPVVTFALTDGSVLPLRSLTGHRIYLHFWASWCAPCRVEFSSLLEQLAKTDGKTVLLTVSGDSSREDLDKFIAPFQKQYSSLFSSKRIIVAHDPKHTIIENVFQTFKYPETIVISEQLRMERKIIGPAPKDVFK